MAILRQFPLVEQALYPEELRRISPGPFSVLHWLQQLPEPRAGPFRQVDWCYSGSNQGGLQVPGWRDSCGVVGVEEHHKPTKALAEHRPSISRD